MRSGETAVERRGVAPLLTLLLAGILWIAAGCGTGVTASSETDTARPEGDVALPWGNGDLPRADVLDFRGGELVPEDPCADPVPGGFCSPCEEDAECDSGFCVWTPMGKVCTETCVEDCPLDWSCEVVGGTWPDVIYVCLPRFLFLCDPCTADADCNVVGMTEGAVCHDQGPPGSFCAEPCKGGDTPCPKDYTCTELDMGGTMEKFCLPDGECPCSPMAIASGLSTACAVANEFGACAGMRMCVEEGLTACDGDTPGAEVCDGLDNDCDGQVDEDLGTIACGPEGCTTEIPACVDGTPAVCVPDSELTEEVCDGVDNDCDGQVDEGIAPLVCGVGVCEHEEAACVDGEVATCDPFAGAQVESCNGLDDDCNGLVDDGESPTGCTLYYVDNDGDGYGVAGDFLCLCEPESPYDAIQAGDCNDESVTVYPFAPEICDGKDNNCNGVADEGLGTVECGVGKCFHEQVACVNGVPAVCDPFLGATPEQCNNVDDDCDGLVDDGLGAVQCGVGKCFHQQEACIAGVPQVCDAFAGATPESCNGIDDDCDGLTDEDLGTTSCGVGKCFHTVNTCLNGQPQVCDPFQGATPETCNNVDDDCDGQVDDGLAPLVCGGGACQVTIPSCVNGVPQQCGNIGQEQPEVCDGFDNDCDGQVDEGLAPLVCGFGACQVTIPSCVNGVPQQCGNLGQPQTEMCDGLDNDCDGQVDEAGALGCQWYYADQDGDGWGADNDKQCLCSPVVPYTKNQGGDCYDASSAVYPGNQAWYTEHRGDGLYDYNCDGVETYQFNEMFYCSPTCTFSTPGWYAYKPPCGQNGAFGMYCLNLPFDICDIHAETMPAACH